MLTILQQKMLLVIVDTSLAHNLLLEYLKGFGFQLLIANGGESALSIVEHVRPDAALIDVLLPGMDGFETCRYLKAKRATQDIPIILMHDSSNPVDKVRGLSLGAVDFITKPIHSEELLARLKTHLTLQALQNELAEKNRRLEQEIIEREQLIVELNAFAHDLKNPLGVTMNYAYYLKKYYDRLSPEDFAEQTEAIARNGRRMTRIIDSLLLLASTRHDQVEMEPVEMGEIVIEVQQRLGDMIAEYQAEVVVPSRWPTVWGYSAWVEEIWTNYMSNALKYGGRPPQVTLGVTKISNKEALFWVQDNGDGISAEAQARLFQPFNRLEQVNVAGHGLGLSIVKRIAERMGGGVGVESRNQPGQGTRFSFKLPLFVD